MRSCVLIFACLATLTVAKSLHRTGRITQGTSVSIEEVPYQVSLLHGDRLLCGGSIISAEYVLTAAHCLEAVEKQFLNVRSGSSSAESGGTLHKAVQVISHEHYRYNATEFNDIGLIRVEPPFNFDKTRQPVALIESNKVIEPGKYGKVTGFGVISGSGPLSKNLQLIEIEIVSKEKCEKIYSASAVPFDSICAHNSEGKDSCAGDGGGPLIVDGNLTGIVSMGTGCASPDHPGIYTDVARHRDFIKQYAGV